MSGASTRPVREYQSAPSRGRWAGPFRAEGDRPRPAELEAGARVGEAAARRLIWLPAAAPLLVLAALALRTAGRAPDFDDPIWLDVGHAIATTGVPLRSYLMTTRAMFFDHTPLYAYLVGGLSLAGGDTVTIARFVSLLFGLGTVAVVYAIGLRVSVTMALVASLLVAGNEFFGWLSWLMRMETAWAFFSMLGLWALLERRWILAGLAIATSVMFKELGLAFWLVAGVYTLTVSRRAALLVAVPTVVAFAGWIAYAAWLDWDQLMFTLWRWGDAAGAGTIADVRMHVTPVEWTMTLVQALGLSFVALAVAVLRPTRDALVPLAYAGLAIVSSYAITLKEPRYLSVVIPMAAAGLALSWRSAPADEGHVVAGTSKVGAGLPKQPHPAVVQMNG